MRVLTSKGGDLASYYDKIDGNTISNTCLKQIFIINHNIVSNKGRNRANTTRTHNFLTLGSFLKNNQEIKISSNFKTVD